LHIGFLKKSGENTHRVATTANTGNPLCQAFRQSFQRIVLGFNTYNPLKSRTIIGNGWGPTTEPMQ
jgi:hypothetical protein